jgi:hypothetical protein
MPGQCDKPFRMAEHGEVGIHDRDAVADDPSRQRKQQIGSEERTDAWQQESLRLSAMEWRRQARGMAAIMVRWQALDECVEPPSVTGSWIQAYHLPPAMGTTHE